MVIDVLPDAEARRKRLGRIVRVLLVGFAPALLFIMIVFSVVRRAVWGDPDTTGTITSTGESGNWTMHISSCGSGQPYSYFGVGLFDRHQKDLQARIVLPESGEAHVTASIPGTNQEMNFPRSLCSTWDVDVEPTHTMYNHVRELQGHAKFTCDVPDGVGGHITGDVVFDSCA